MILFRNPVPGQESIWFAWRPVELQDGRVVWWEYVHRTYVETLGGWGKYIYERI